MIRRAAIVVLFVAGCAGLGTGDALDPLPIVAPRDAGLEAGTLLRVDLGTGVDAYQPLADGALVDVVLGPQGGFHIWTGVHVHDPTLDLARIDLSTRFSDDGTPAGTPSSITATLTPVEGGREHAGMTSFISSPEAVRGRRLILHVEVYAQDGRRGFAERAVIPR